MAKKTHKAPQKKADLKKVKEKGGSTKQSARPAAVKGNVQKKVPRKKQEGTALKGGETSNSGATAPRISQILIRGFRAFPGNEDYLFAMGAKGKNLLLFGENGSGKSSLFKGLNWLLQSTVPEEDFATHKNVFWTDPGVIRITMTAGSPSEFEWAPEQDHPAKDGGPVFHDLVRRTTMLGYRDLLRTSMDHELRPHIDLYKLVTEVILGDHEIPDGRQLHHACLELKEQQQLANLSKAARSAKLGFSGDKEALEEMEDLFQSRVQEMIPQVFDTVRQILSDHRGLVARANELLFQLEPGLSVTFDMQEWRARINGGESADRRLGLFLRCQYQGYDIEHPGHFLNEARLTAMSLALYLAGAELCVPRGAADPRILVLDDVLIGLDMAHRVPILKMLQEEFAAWQIILITHDPVWYDLARMKLPPDQWVTYKLFDLPSEEDMPPRPVKRPGLSYLEQAEQHLEQGYPLESAVNARAAFEEVLKDAAEELRLALPYKKDPTNVTANELWRVVQKAKDKSKNHDLLPKELIRDVESMRSKILNELSHSGPRSLGKAEAQFAIHVVRWLKAALEQKQ